MNKLSKLVELFDNQDTYKIIRKIIRDLVVKISLYDRSYNKIDNIAIADDVINQIFIFFHQDVVVNRNIYKEFVKKNIDIKKIFDIVNDPKIINENDKNLRMFLLVCIEENVYHLVGKYNIAAWNLSKRENNVALNHDILYHNEQENNFDIEPKNIYKTNNEIINDIINKVINNLPEQYRMYFNF